MFRRDAYREGNPALGGDTYVLDYQNPEDELLGLMLVIAIDAANCSNG